MTEISENTLSLYFGLHEGKNADLEIISQSAIEWVNSVKLSAKMIDPSIEVRVEFINAHEGSLSLNTVLDWGEAQLEKLEHIKHPKLTKLALALALFVVIDAGGVHDYWLGEPDKLELSQEDRKILNDIFEKISKSEEVKKRNQKFFHTVNQDTAVKSVAICEKPDSIPAFSVPSTQFGERSGLWEPEIEIRDRTSERTSDVILEAAILSGANRKWQFLDVATGKKFNAKMRDEEFIKSLQEGRIEESLRTGIRMQIFIKFKELFENGNWKSDPSTIEVMKATLAKDPPIDG